jgi:hypothetical protein
VLHGRQVRLVSFTYPIGLQGYIILKEKGFISKLSSKHNIDY